MSMGPKRVCQAKNKSFRSWERLGDYTIYRHIALWPSIDIALWLGSIDQWDGGTPNESVSRLVIHNKSLEFLSFCCAVLSVGRLIPYPQTYHIHSYPPITGPVGKYERETGARMYKYICDIHEIFVNCAPCMIPMVEVVKGKDRSSEYHFHQSYNYMKKKHVVKGCKKIQSNWHEDPTNQSNLLEWLKVRVLFPLSNFGGEWSEVLQAALRNRLVSKGTHQSLLWFLLPITMLRRSPYKVGELTPITLGYL